MPLTLQLMLWAFGGFALLMVVLIPIGLRHQRARDGALRLWAESKGMTYHESSEVVNARYRDVEPFEGKRSRVLKNVMQGGTDINLRRHAVMCSDFYGSNKNDDSGPTVHSLVVIDTPYRTPKLIVMRRGLLNRALIASGMQDINFEDADFSKAFHVMSDDRAFAYEILSPQVIEHLKLWPRSMKRSITSLTVHNGVVVAYKRNSHWRSPSQFERVLRFAAGFVDRWPDHLLAEWENDPSFRTGVTISNDEFRPQA